ncbi:hypothetical protein ENUP19_0055G0049 [Entamoeba nuttalli]|uniref:Uncharacterized protein n=1 Tax=Entamoeba nuttalli TaxID=412467 RepID=A0ABQ0DCY6_9EUKA
MEDQQLNQSFSNNELLNEQIQYLKVQQSELRSLPEGRSVWCRMGAVYLPTTRESTLQVIDCLWF